MMVNHDHGMMNVDFSKSKREHFGRNNTQELEEEEGVMHAVVDFRNMSLGTLPLTSNINLGIVYKLDISKNNIQVIPESLIARLLNVGVLDVHSNQLRTIPNSIGCLSKLKTLNISGNLLQSLPKTIQNCKALEHLNLSVNSNKLTFLPSSTSHLTNLCHLDARLNHLGSLPNDLGNLINLEILNISQNFRYLDTLPYSLGLVFSLVELDISHNNISTLPDSMGCLKRLRKLHLEGNPLMSPPPEVVDQGLHVMKEYLREKINRQKSPKEEVLDQKTKDTWHIWWEPLGASRERRICDA
ncbi:putative leucine-rich repeat domain superfamily [Helianthus annuus]|nr:putative leucine-rich repeat domain superfamily [Helianthus annuus]